MRVYGECSLPLLPPDLILVLSGLVLIFSELDDEEEDLEGSISVVTVGNNDAMVTSVECQGFNKPTTPWAKIASAFKGLAPPDSFWYYD